MVIRIRNAVCFWLLPATIVLSGAVIPHAVTAATWDLWDDAEQLLVQEAQPPAEPSPVKEVAAVPEKTVEAAPASVERTVPPPTRSDAVASAGGPGYEIGPGDVLDVSVWKDEALSRSVVVLPDGTISFPLVGKVEVAGKTVQQVRERMVTELSRYVPELELTIDVKQSNSMMVYVIGRVNAPGRQIINSNVTVLQALAMAGGLNPFANRNKIKVFRKEGEAKSVLSFRYNDVMDGNLESNVELKRGDVIVVP
jgi:polysaccharide export outer membrane protein